MRLRRVASALGRRARSVVAARSAGRARPGHDAIRRARLEPFGAIVQLARPRALVFVDRTYARSLGIAPRAGSPPWQAPDDDGEVGRTVLSAPLEAHLQLTNRCDAGCRGCYTGATPAGAAREWGAGEWKRAIDALDAMGVFHLALGGGESATLPWLGEVAAHARARGMVPNLTTSGLAGLDSLIRIADRFGQINVSMDGLGDRYAAVRGFDGFARADRAVCALRAVKREIGINVVVTRDNFDQLDALFAYARQRRLSEVELLRFKPSGRGVKAYAQLACTRDQHARLLPAVLAACRRHRVRVKVDCSYTPMLAHHRPDRELLASLAVYGCTGGDFLIGARANGALTACSFAAPARRRTGARGGSREAGPDRSDRGGASGHASSIRSGGSGGSVGSVGSIGSIGVDEIAAYWGDPAAFGAFRAWRAAAEPCASCEYHALCRGGCKVVSAHLLGDERLPDPECPRVIAWRERAARAGENGQDEVRDEVAAAAAASRGTRKLLPVVGKV